MEHNIYSSEKLSWLDGENIRPYIFIREDNKIEKPATAFENDWFPFEALRMDPLCMDHVTYADQILNLEHLSFKKAGMPMPRWVFYDCAIMPGFVAGFAHKTSTLPAVVQKALGKKSLRDWTPISLFITIPSIATNEWVAHNLCSVNSQLKRSEKFYGLGFLTKAFALWYANVNICCGMTQWTSPALQLHSHYGVIEILTAFTPVHDYPHTLTYRLKVDTTYWTHFFKPQVSEDFENSYESAGFEVNPKLESSLISLQRKIEAGEGPFYLRPSEIREQEVGQPLTIYRPKC